MNHSHAQGNWIQNIMKSHQVPFLELVKSLDQAFSLRLERKIVAAYDPCCRSVLPCFLDDRFRIAVNICGLTFFQDWCPKSSLFVTC